METLLTVRAPQDIAFCSLAVTVVGMTISVAPGAVRFEQEDFELLEEETFTVSSGAFPVGVEGYLVEVGGELRLFVIEHVQNGIDPLFDLSLFPDHRLLHLLFALQVPPGATDLDPLPRMTWHVVLPESEVV